MKNTIASSNLEFLSLSRIYPLYMISEAWGRKRQTWMFKEAILDWPEVGKNSSNLVLNILAYTHIQVSETSLDINYTTQLCQLTKISGLGFQCAFNLVCTCLGLAITHQIELHQKAEDLVNENFLGSLPLSGPV